MNDKRQAFGLALRNQREQLGIPIHVIAESTKISVTMLTALERGDVSRWPKGIFRRAFFREYVVAIGLTPDALSSEFARLFPEEPSPAPPPAGELRLALAARESPAAVVLRRVAVVAGELAVVSLVGVASTWIAGIETLPAIGLAALVYYPAASLCVDRKWGFGALRAIAKSPMPETQTELERYEEIDGREELQVSF